MQALRLLKRVFDIDLEHCPLCGGEFKIIAAIEEPVVIVSILTHLGLPARAPIRRSNRHHKGEFSVVIARFTASRTGHTVTVSKKGV